MVGLSRRIASADMEGLEQSVFELSRLSSRI